MKSHNRAIAGLLAACAAATAHATEPLPADLFARHSQISDIALSPDGNRVALTVPAAEGMETHLQIVPLDDQGDVQAMRFGKQQHITDIHWTSNQRLVVSRAKMEPLEARPYSVGELVATNADGSDQELLFCFVPDTGTRTGQRKDQGYSYITDVLRAQPGMALVAFRCWNCGEEPDTVLFRVDTRSGQRKEIERMSGDTRFGADNAGVARIAVGYDINDDPVVQYRPTPASDWQPLPRTLAGYSLEPLRFAVDDNLLYALVSDHREPERLYRIDLSAGTRSLLAGRADMDISDVLFEGHDGAPFAVSYDAGKPTVDYIDEASPWASLHAGLMRKFPGEMVEFGNSSNDGNKLLFNTWSDRHPGAWYVYDRAAGRIQLIAESMPWIEPARMAPMRPVEFDSRDGRRLFGFYTAHGSGPKPLVVLPHGGPHGPYDSWGYDSQVQFLASRGYAVLQVNYRGSGGRGQSFIQDGYRQWGGGIQDDIADGVRWAIAQQIADPGRICIYGASFGGYAALMNPIRYPDLYQCAIGHVGVYDLQVMFKEGDLPGRRSGRRYLERVLGTDPVVLAANSPAQQVDKLTIPVLLAQGRLDQRVPMDQFVALTRAFDKAGRPAQTLVIGGEGHGFYKPENQARLYRTMAGFLDRHIGDQAAPGATGAVAE